MRSCRVVGRHVAFHVLARGRNTFGAGQNMSAQSQIEAVLDSSSLPYVRDDQDAFYVFEGLPLPLWISVAARGRFIKLYTYVDVRDGASERDVLEFVNKINAHYFPNSVSYRWGKLWSYYYIPIGLSEIGSGLVEMMVVSTSHFLAGVRDLDRHNLVI